MTTNDMAPEDDTPKSSDSEQSSQAKQTDEWPLAGKIALGCVAAPVVVVAAGFMAVKLAVDVIEMGVDVVIEAAGYVQEKATDKANTLIDNKVKSGAWDAESSGAKMLKGAGQIGYGLLRGGMAVSGALGHGMAGYFLRQKNSYAASQLVRHGFEVAAEQIGKGADNFSDGLEETFKG